MATITINTVAYYSYASLEIADAYLGAEISATNWQASDDNDKKGRSLVSATRWLNRLVWGGDKTDSDQTNAFPRTGIDGVEDDEIPQNFLDACCLLASAIFDGLDVNLNTAAGGGTKRLKADTVEIEYWRASDEAVLPLPLSVWQLINAYLGGGSISIEGAESTGTTDCWPFEAGWGMTGGI